MVNTAQQEEGMRQYLLGEMAEAEKDALDEAIFADNETFDRMWAVENDLIDYYVRGRLSPVEREQFERHYLASPKHRERVAVARTLLKTADAEAVYESRMSAPLRPKLADLFRPLRLALTSALAMAFLLCALWSGYLLIERNRLLDELAKLSANDAFQKRNLEKILADERLRSEQLKAEIEKLQAQQKLLEAQPSPTIPAAQPSPTIPAAQPAFVTLQLTSSLVRNKGNKIPELKIPRGTGEVRLQMNFTSGDYRRGHIVVRNVDAVNAWQQVGLKIKSEDSTSSVVANVPAEKLPPGDYIVTLTGITASGETVEIDRYPFRVLRSSPPIR